MKSILSVPLAIARLHANLFLFILSSQSYETAHCQGYAENENQIFFHGTRTARHVFIRNTDTGSDGTPVHQCFSRVLFRRPENHDGHSGTDHKAYLALHVAGI